MTRILILNGPNLNLIGTRETGIYGSKTLAEINDELMSYGKKAGVEVVCKQSNHEGVLIDELHAAQKEMDAVIFNAGAYTHTSIALRDAIAAIDIPVIEVHMSNVSAREEFRHISYISAVCKGTIAGFGWKSYMLALVSLIE